jgi:hypothetical protein
MKMFRYPLVTYLTSTTFKALGTGLEECVKLLEKSDAQTDLYEVHYILSLLQLIHSNFGALNFCQINLNKLLPY